MSAKTASKPVTTKHKRLRGRMAAVGLLLGAVLVVVGWSWLSHRRYNDAMLAIENHVAEGRNSAACRDIQALLEGRKDADGSLHYLLGSCELARGHLGAAEDAWGAIEPGTAFSERAVLGRMMLLRTQGKPALAERLIAEAAADSRNDRTALMVGLVPILIDLGRREEATERIRERWEALDARGEGALEPAIKLLLWHVELATEETVDTESARTYLDEAARLAPDDDRVWLGRANLALQNGDLSETARLLDASEKKRPKDRAVWQARAKWAMATENVEAVERALKRMPPEEAIYPLAQRINAWLANRRGDRAKERWELEQWIVVDPEETSAYDRLIELHKNEGRSELAAEVAQRKNAARERLDRYRKLKSRKQPIRDAEEMSTIARRLGRQFEARAFLTIALFQEPERQDLKDQMATFGSEF